MTGSGAIVAPAGHGKTYTIGQTVKAHPEMSILVLTHTHAGIAALKNQIGSRPIRQLRIETIASFALKIARAFPKHGGWNEAEGVDMDAAHISANQAMHSRTILNVVCAPFDLMIVDEYQDCSLIQASIIDLMTSQVPTVVVGDPLQGIYDFGSQPSVNWSGTSTNLPYIDTLPIPHRWSKTNPSLGEWLLSVRQNLLADKSVIFNQSVMEVIQLDRKPAEGGLSGLIMDRVSTAIITPDSAVPHAIPRIARSYRGRARVAEAAAYPELHKAAQNYNASDPVRNLLALIELASKSKTAVIEGPVRTLRDNLRDHGVASRRRSQEPIVLVAQSHLECGSAESAAGFLRAVIAHGTYIYRPELTALMFRSLKMKSVHDELSLDECVEVVLEQRNHMKLPERQGAVVGSTLRLKGLEFDTVVVLDPMSIPNAKHFYVAMTRATRRLIVAYS